MEEDIDRTLPESVSNTDSQGSTGSILVVMRWSWILRLSECVIELSVLVEICWRLLSAHVVIRIRVFQRVCLMTSLSELAHQLRSVV